MKDDRALIARLEASIKKRQEEGLLRTLSSKSGLIDFCSNDYLGFAHSTELKDRLLSLSDELDPDLGSTGSRLLSGNSELFETLEKELAQFHNAESGLIFNSGYDANLALFQALPRRGDTILYDQRIHASIKAGVRLSLAPSYSFLHNDLSDLERRLSRATGVVFVATESLFSMDGDFAPLQELCELCDKYDAYLIVDEAHATGIYGKKGEGLVSALQLEDQVFIRMHTFGKALGCHGAFIACSKVVREYLINFAHSFIYTTALPTHTLLSIKAAYALLSQNLEPRKKLQELISYFVEGAKKLKLNIFPNAGPIQIVILPGTAARAAQQRLQDAGVDVRAILPPTVAIGAERLRIILHSFNTNAQVDKLLALLAALEKGRQHES